MNKLKLVSATALVLCLIGCKTTVKSDDPDFKVKGGGYEVEVESGDHKGDFCPPGQAKKGNC